MASCRVLWELWARLWALPMQSANVALRLSGKPIAKTDRLPLTKLTKPARKRAFLVRAWRWWVVWLLVAQLQRLAGKF